jgi:hypothetical protein
MLHSLRRAFDQRLVFVTGTTRSSVDYQLQAEGRYPAYAVKGCHRTTCLQSVAHMPMKAMVYKTLSTVVDDFFA